jgi:hypothetical protein
MLKEKLPFALINTLLLHIPLLALTDGQTDRETNTPAACWLEELFSFCLRKIYTSTPIHAPRVYGT